MISSEVLSEFHVDGDIKRAVFLQNKNKQMESIQPSKRMKTTNVYSNPNKQLAEEFFYQTHPFTDMTLIVQDKELYVDKSVLAAGSKVFQSYFQEESIDSIEILDVSPNEMIELLRFLYPQFECIISSENATLLLTLARRFEINFIVSACRSFIQLYLSKLEYINLYPNSGEFIEQEDGVRLPISYILNTLCIWFREFQFMEDYNASETIINKLAKCSTANVLASSVFTDLEENLKWKIFQARAKYLESQQ